MTHPLHRIDEISDVARPDVVAFGDLLFAYFGYPVVDEHCRFYLREEPVVIDVSESIRNLIQELIEVPIDKFSYHAVILVSHEQALNVRG